MLFTSGGTEADNLAVMGGHEAAGPATAPVVTTHTEHAAVTEAVGRLAAGGAPVRWAEVDAGGVLTASALAEAIDGGGGRELRRTELLDDVAAAGAPARRSTEGRRAPTATGSRRWRWR